MSLDWKARYPGQMLDEPATYPQGRARNVVSKDDGTGTPFERDLVNDRLGFHQALLLEAGITPSGTPDTAIASDMLAALKQIFDANGAALQWDAVNFQWADGTELSGSDGRWYVNVDTADNMRRFMVDSQAVDVGANVQFTPTIVEGRRPNNAIDEVLGEIAFINGAATAVSTANDGGETNPDVRTALPTSGSWQAAAYSEPLGMWCVGGTGKIATSTNLDAAWSTPTAPHSGAVHSVRAFRGAPGFVLTETGEQTDFHVSADGVTWTTISTALSAQWKAAVYSPAHGKFFIFGRFTPGPNAEIDFYEAAALAGPWTKKFDFQTNADMQDMGVLGSAVVLSGGTGEALQAGMPRGNIHVLTGGDLRTVRAIRVGSGTQTSLLDAVRLLPHEDRLLTFTQAGAEHRFGWSQRVPGEMNVGTLTPA